MFSPFSKRKVQATEPIAPATASAGVDYAKYHAARPTHRLSAEEARLVGQCGGWWSKQLRARPHKNQKTRLCQFGYRQLWRPPVHVTMQQVDGWTVFSLPEETQP